MTDLTIERSFDAPQETVFAFLTEPENLEKWWGHEAWTFLDKDLDLTRPGPWHSRASGAQGDIYHLSGEVIEVDAPSKIRFTWAWHDNAGQRGQESEVTFTVQPESATTSRLVLFHTGLANEDAAIGHENGWNAVLDRLQALLE